MIDDFIVRAPVKVKPKLPKGRLHKLLITTEKLEIYNWENVYGNKISEKLFSVGHKQILEIEFKKPLLHTKESYCKIIYENEVGIRNCIEFSVLNTSDLYRLQSGPYNQNKTTEKVASLLKTLTDPNVSISRYSKTLDIPFKPPKSIIKFLAGLVLPITTAVGWAGGIQSLFWVSLFLFFPSLMAIGIDYVRLNVGWSAWAKFAAYVFIFIFLFVAMITIIFLVEYYHPFQ